MTIHQILASKPTREAMKFTPPCLGAISTTRQTEHSMHVRICRETR